MYTKIEPVDNPKVIKAVTKFHETLAKNKHYGISYVTALSPSPSGKESIFYSGLTGYLSFAWNVAEIIHIASAQYDVSIRKLLKEVIEYVEDLDSDVGFYREISKVYK